MARGRPALPALGVRNSGRDAGALRDQARGVSSLAPAELMGKFESLGHNCEFGLAQRQMGNETLGLLRFSGIDPSQLIDGLEVGFEGVDEAAGLKIEARGKVTQEFIGRVEKYRIEFHTHRPAEMDKIKAVRREVLASLKFRRRMLLEHMENADKIFVFQNGGAMGVEEARAILTVLRKYGNNSLLFVTESDGEVGSARVVEDGIYHGVVARFAPWDRVDREVDGEVWLSVCANAYRLWREDGGKS